MPTVETLAACAPSVPGVTVFDDTDPLAYWSDTNPLNSVKVNGHRVKVTVVSGGDDDLVISVVNPVKRDDE